MDEAEGSFLGEGFSDSSITTPAISGLRYFLFAATLRMAFTNSSEEQFFVR